ncbi:MAG: phosphoribosylformylglycinamidine synthase subunit PurQ [Candidatus Methylomirabilis oxygeniifera]|uniref:Phosphoribosylformylglycinamidine synthase subunit PurQ n=1 Tax=Methylomirabilis oxygeniifera TaxID=671143 RepID=D5MKL3_METO1|nr:MAG: phosphoribosylformylglycinamidine synthase subunit PurQ [Candidatus Methylomirabilis oxyfera]CBE67660.1 phosphoribosylformylglycinamidine synthase I (FGAM synthase I) [Candidatus Methylomirabilis oxyfera]
MKFGIVVFPGSWSHQDFHHVIVKILKEEACYLWHKEADLHGVDCVILPGGFAHGDYLRSGAIARLSPVMRAVAAFADAGGLILGSCNGFQILTEAGLLPGALLPNDCLHYRCRWVHLRTESRRTPFTTAMQPGQVVRMPISHGDGRYYIDQTGWKKLIEGDQIIFRYCDAKGTLAKDANPNGSFDHIAGICNERRNVLGLMPHPERAAESILGSQDGYLMFASILDSFIRSPLTACGDRA